MSVPVRATRRIHRKCRGNRFTNQLLLQKLTSCSNSSRGALKMKTINAIILAVVVMFVACAQPPVAPSINVSVRILQEQATSDPDSDPDLFVSPTNFDLGKVNRSSSFVITNQGGGEMSYNVTNSSSRVTMAGSLSGTLGAGKNVEISFSVNAGTVADSAKVHVTSGSNEKVVRISWDVEAPVHVPDPDLFVSPTNFDLGKVNRSSSFVITNQGGGEMSYNVTNSSSRVTMAGSLSGTLGAGKNVEISFSVNAGTVADSAKVHVTSGSNEKVVRISWDVEAPVHVPDPDLFVSPTNFDLGKVNRSSSFVITNQGGGEMSDNVTNSSSRVTMAGSLSGTLGAGKNVEISFSVNAGTVADSAKVHVTSGSNEKVVRISWDVEAPVHVPDPDLFVSPTNFDLGKVNRSSSFVITNQGGGEMSYNVTNSSSRVTMAGSLSGTLGAGKNVEISFSVNAGTVADSAKVHVTSGSNEKVVRISWDVADEALDNWYVVPVKDAAVVRGDKGMEGKIYPCVERFQVASPGVYSFKGIQVDDSNSYEQLDESWFIGVKDHPTGKYARCTNATITSNVDGHGMLDVFPVIDFERS